MAVERTELRQRFDKVTQKLAPANFWLTGAGTAILLATGAYPLAAVGGINMYSDWRTWHDKGKSPEKQSSFSMPSLLDRMGIGVKGSERSNSPSTRMATAAA